MSMIEVLPSRVSSVVEKGGGRPAEMTCDQASVAGSVGIVSHT